MKNELGFGCVKLTSNYTKKQAIRNLEVAFDNGIKHFDVARLYGFGLSEGILGDFSKNKRSSITITTKFGIDPNNTLLKNLFLQNVIRSVYRKLKKSRVQKQTSALASNSMTSKDFSLVHAEKSIDTSLKELKTDYIDYLLLHEPLISEANNEELIHFLEQKKKAGIIKEFGIASFSDTVFKEYAHLNIAHTILQTSNSFPACVPKELLISNQMLRKFYFSPFLYLSKVSQMLTEDATLKKQLSDLVGFDLDKKTIDLFFMHQVVTDRTGTVLFTSSKNDKIIDTVQSWNRVMKLSNENYVNFSKVRDLITDRLFIK